MPKVSVITINYNNASGVKKTIESVITQNYSDYEYILIDGGSTDDSKDIIEKYKDRFNYCISEPDNGIYHAMNKGIALSTGEYLHFLNSGDCYASENILNSVFSTSYAEPFIRGTQICDYGDRRVRWSNLGDKNITLYDMYTNTMLHEATFIRRDMFEKYGLYDEKLSIVSDWKFFLKAILGGENTIFIDKDFIVFEMDGVSTNKMHGERLLEERKKVVNEILPANIIADYERLKSLEADAYIPELIKSNSLYMNMFRVMNKLNKIFK